MSTNPFNAVLLNYKMNDIIKEFLLAGDRFMPEMHLRQPGFTYSTCGAFTKNKEKMEKFKQNYIRDSRYIYKIQDIFAKMN